MLRIFSLRNIFINYFWIFVFSALEGILTGKAYLISILFPVVTYLLAFKYGFGKRTFIDIIFFLIVFSMLTSWIMNTYRFQYALIFRCIMAEGSYMIAYFIGKNMGIKYFDEIFNRALLPMIICCILGIYFFFRPPGWYLEQLYDSMRYVSGDLSLELLRLRSIFSSPYVMAYMCGLSIIYLLFRIFKNGENNIKLYSSVGLFVLTMLFAMMRAPILCIVLSFIISLFYYSFYNGSVKVFFITIIFAIILLFIVSLILGSLNSDVLYFIMSKFDSATSGRSELISDRVSMWDYKYDFLGDGAGRHALLADNFVLGSAIADSEYVKILVEQGYLGLSFYIALILFCILKCIRYFRYLPLELCIMIFYSVTMIGADSLSTPDKHCFIFWLVVGRISAFRKVSLNQVLAKK